MFTKPLSDLSNHLLKALLRAPLSPCIQPDTSVLVYSSRAANDWCRLSPVISWLGAPLYSYKQPGQVLNLIYFMVSHQKQAVH